VSGDLWRCSVNELGVGIEAELGEGKETGVVADELAELYELFGGVSLASRRLRRA